MDLTYTAAEEQFRDDLRSWLGANIPPEWRSPAFWAALPDDESFRLRRDWERAKADAGFAGNRHPDLLGKKVLEAWPEAADLNSEVMSVCMGGGTLQFNDERLVLNRRGKPEEGWMDLFYSPVIDESGRPGGVIATRRTPRHIRRRWPIRGRRAPTT